MNQTPGTGPSPMRTALVLVDVINSFFEVGNPNYYDSVTAVLPALHDLLRRARENDTFVVHAVERHYAGLDDFEFTKLPRHHEDGANEADFFPGFEPAVRSREVVIPKRRYSAFYATDLDLFLREQGIGRLVIAGVKTNVCIRATVQDAFAGGFDVVVPREATNSNRPHLAEASLEDIERYFGQVVDLADAIELL
jgi:nicotinamidase-related amidase